MMDKANLKNSLNETGKLMLNVYETMKSGLSPVKYTQEQTDNYIARLAQNLKK